MVDLKGQYLKIQNEIDEAIKNVIHSTAFIHGPAVQEFENNLAQYLGVKHVIACANGTDALQIALMATDLKHSDEVLVPDFTFVASAEVVGLLGYHPVLTDVDYESFNAGIEQMKQAISIRTKAIIPVHLFGQSCNMEPILELAQRYDLTVIEDNAQAIGAEYTFLDGVKAKTGTIGNIGCTSFFPSKNLGGYGDGGALFTNDDALAEKIRTIANHGMAIRYHHERLGVNSRLDSIQAAILNVKLKYIDLYSQARRNAAHFYNEGLKDIEDLVIPFESEFSTHVYHQYTLKVLNGRRNDLKNYLEAEGIPAMIYYPIPLHKQEAFLTISRQRTELTNTEKLCDEVLSLPMHTELTEEVQCYIIEKIHRFFGK